MVGLRNQGATCYLNSLLQSLYLTGAFRKAVYQIPTETEQDRVNSASAYALQRLFYRLQADLLAVGTQELTHSFGWESRQIFEQQDVQELSRILMEKLEARMKGTEAENALPNMFVGKMKTYLRCINVDYESSRIEDFWDLQLNVSGCKSVQESFKDYIQVETLEGTTIRRRRLWTSRCKERNHLRAFPQRPSPAAEAFRIRLPTRRHDESERPLRISGGARCITIPR